jgi:hypothetical protein
MNLGVTVDVSDVVKLTATVLRQLPYATNAAITRTSKEAVDAVRNELRRDLTIRKQFILGRIRILQYSKVGNLTAVIGLDANVQGAPLLLGFLEEGGEKLPIAGEGIAIPLTGEAARPTFAQSVPTAFRYKNLRFSDNKGRQKTYIVPNVGVFQRFAPGKAGSELIYSFKPSAVLPIHTHIRDAMVTVIEQRFSTIFSEEFAREVLHKASRVAT